METISLIWEIALLAIALYGYAFSRGFVRSKDPQTQQKMDTFRAKNRWLTFASLLLLAITVANLYLRFFGNL